MLTNVFLVIMIMVVQQNQGLAIALSWPIISRQFKTLTFCPCGVNGYFFFHMHGFVVSLVITNLQGCYELIAVHAANM